MNYPSVASDSRRERPFLYVYLKINMLDFFPHFKPTKASLDREGSFSIRPLAKKLLNTWLEKIKDKNCMSGMLKLESYMHSSSDTTPK